MLDVGRKAGSSANLDRPVTASVPRRGDDGLSRVSGRASEWPRNASAPSHRSRRRTATGITSATSDSSHGDHCARSAALAAMSIARLPTKRAVTDGSAPPHGSRIDLQNVGVVMVDPHDGVGCRGDWRVHELISDAFVNSANAAIALALWR